MTVTVTLNSSGVAAKASAGPLSPAPPISNCLGKLVVLISCSDASVSVTGISGATYYLAGTIQNFNVYIKNGEASEPTPTISYSSSSNYFLAQIFVLDITGGSWPTIAADGQGVAAVHQYNSLTGTVMRYGSLTVVGGGAIIQACRKKMGAGSLPTSVDTTSGYTQVAYAAPGETNASVMAAQLKNALSVFGSDIPENDVNVNTNTDSNTSSAITLELTVIPSQLRKPNMSGGFAALSGGFQ